MEAEPTVSIIINNYNYGRFLAEAISSSLDQTYLKIEVIVVDDGSTDNSCDVISAYGTRIIPVLKQNGGQSSALNAGVDVSRGEVIFFLDSDDIFLPNKVEEMVKLFFQVVQDNPDVIFSNYIETINESGQPVDIGILDTLSAAFGWDYLHEIRGRRNRLLEGRMTKMSTPEQVFQFAAKYRFIPYLAMPTSGFAMTRSLAKKVFPIPHEGITVLMGADEFIVKGASLLGNTYLTNSAFTKYRIHGKNSDWHGSDKASDAVKFANVVDEFLNSKLRVIGRKPVFSQLSSIQAKGYYRMHHGSRELFELALKVIKWHINLTTIKFFVKTMVLVIIFKFRRTLNSSV